MAELEAIMREYLLETLRKEKGLSYDDIARKVYGVKNMQHSRLKLYRLRKPSIKNGSLKKLTFNDYIYICEALGENPVEILARVIAMANKKTESKDENAEPQETSLAVIKEMPH